MQICIGEIMRIFKRCANILILFAMVLTAMSVQAATPGALSGRFSINDKGGEVVFSQGNLQFQASTGTWRFAEHQTDIIGEDNVNVSSTYSGWVDLFGWGTSGYNGHEPWTTAYSYTHYDTEGDLPGTEYDWGYHNAISNGGNQPRLWRTMTNLEWYYVMRLRDNADNLIFPVMIDSLKCLMLLPDDWTPVPGITLRPMTDFGTWSGQHFTSNTFRFDTLTVAQWEQLEQHGAVVFPSAGERTTANGYMQYNEGLLEYWIGEYWGEKMGEYLSLNSTADTKSVGIYAHTNSWGFSVRLVLDYVAPPVEVNEVHVSIEFPDTGTVMPTNAEYSYMSYVFKQDDPLFNTIGSVTVPDTAGYEVSQYSYYTDRYGYLPGGTTLQPATDYYIMMGIVPRHGYAFPADSNGDADVNQITIMVNGASSSLASGSEKTITVAHLFHTSGPTTGLEPTSDSSLKGRGEKVLRDGQLLIIRGDKTYNAQGAEVR